ncbi:hypothetical protein [Proteus penneri]|uniref:hypothetical protein n=1 Tax=Proteus penneri TaxID=102862 RepID=UPI0028890383|nr:hypothetical protein [Proteus penneri]
MRITTTVKNKDDNELIRFTGNFLSDFLMRGENECAYSLNNMQVWIIRKKNGNISVKGYRV